MTPEEAYEEALRRIREAEKAGALELNLSRLKLNRLPPELTCLTSLRSLDLSWCEHLSGDLSPLAGLTSLHSLNLAVCGQLRGDLSPLAGLTSLQSLNLDFCVGFRRFSPLESLLPTLEHLSLRWCNLGDLPLEICGENEGQNAWIKSAPITANGCSPRLQKSTKRRPNRSAAKIAIAPLVSLPLCGRTLAGKSRDCR